MIGETIFHYEFLDLRKNANLLDLIDVKKRYARLKGE